MVPLGPLDGSLHQRNIGLLDLAAGEELRQSRVRAVVLGHHDQPAGLFIEPMHDAGAQVAAGRRKRLEAIEQRVDQRSAVARVFILPRPGMNHHPGRLVDHRQVGVLERHIQRNVFRRGLERRRMRLAGNRQSARPRAASARPSRAGHRPAHRPGRSATAPASGSHPPAARQETDRAAAPWPPPALRWCAADNFRFSHVRPRLSLLDTS